MSARTDGTRTAIARDLLAAMLDGACSAHVNPFYLNEYRRGIAEAPKLAVMLTDALMKELDATEKTT